MDIADAEIEEPNTADAAEERTIVEVQKLGQEIMQNWAKNKISKDISDYKEADPKAASHKKKAPIGTPPSGKSMS